MIKTNNWLLLQRPLQLGALVRSRLPLIGKQEAARYLFIVRVLLAAGLSLWISMRLHMEQPSTALNTALVVMNMGSGNVLSKSVYRILGTFAGGFVAVLLYVAFPQDRLFIFFGLAFWVTICTAGSATQRNNQSYCFILAGYTACLIAMPAINNPDTILMTALLRVAEVFIGLLCCTLVGESLLPSTVSNTLQTAVKGRFTLFDEFVSRTLSRKIDQEDVESKQLGFLRDVATLDSYGAFALYEAGSGAHKSRLRLFNSGFMTVSTSYYSLYNFIGYMPETSKVRPIFEHFCEQLAEVLTPGGKRASTPEEVRESAYNLSLFQKRIRQEAYDVFREKKLEGMERELLAIGLRLLKRFCGDMRAYFMHYAALDSPRPNRRVQRYFFHPSVDTGIAVVTGLRVALCVLLMAAFWYGAALQDISTPLVFACSMAAFQAGSPNPVRSLSYFIVGASCGFFMGLVFYLWVLPNTLYFATYWAAAMPFLGVGVYLISTTKYAGSGRAYCFMFGSLANPGLTFNIDPAQVVINGFYGLMGTSLALILVTMLLPPGGRWWKHRMKQGLYRKMLLACTRDPGKSLISFETGLRDVLLQYTANSGPSTAEKKAMFKRVLVFGGLGRTVLELRDMLRQKRYGKAEKSMLAPLPGLTACFFKDPTPERCFAVLFSVREGMCMARDELAKEADELGGGRAEHLRAAFSSLLIFHQSFLDAARLMPETEAFITHFEGAAHAS